MLPAMVAPIASGEADLVMGSRIMTRGEARRGGMPAYKYAGNRILTTMQNAVVGPALSEWHSGYRAYSVKALESVPFERNADGFHFDPQILEQMHGAGRRRAHAPNN